MIIVKLKDAIESHRQRTGIRLTYDILAKQAGVSVDTLQSLATRPTYNTRLSTIEKLCQALSCTPGDLLELASDQARPPHEDQ